MADITEVTSLLGQVEAVPTGITQLTSLLGQIEVAVSSSIISGNIGLVLGISTKIAASTFNNVDISGRVGLQFGLSGNPQSVISQAGVIRGNLGLKLGLKGSVSGAVSTQTSLIKGNLGLVFGLTAYLSSGLPIGVEVPGKFSLSLGMQGKLVAGHPQVIAVPGSIGLKLGISGDPTAVAVPRAVEVSGVLSLRLGCKGGLASNPLVATEIQGRMGLLLGIGPLTEVGEDYETWVLNDNQFAPAAYTGWPFNSYAQYHGQYYAAGKDGLYLLGGEDQDGEAIHAGVRLLTNFSTARQKRLRAMKLGATGDEVQVRLSTDRGDEGFFDLDGDQVPVSRDVQGRDYTVDIQDFEELSFMEILPLMLVMR